MESFELIVNGKTFKPVFGLKVFRILGRKWNLPGLEGVIARIQVLEKGTGEFEAMDVLEDLLVSAIQAGNNPDFNPDEDSILDEFFKRPELMNQITEALITSMPRPQEDQEQGKPQATPKEKKNP